MEQFPVKKVEATLENKASHEVLAKKIFQEKLAHARKHIEDIAESSTGNAGFALLDEIPDTVNFGGGPTDWDVYYRAGFDLLKERPDLGQAVEEIEGALGQNGQMFDPQTYLETVTDITTSVDTPDWFKDAVMNSFAYTLAWYGENRYEQVVADTLDFDHPENFTRTGRFLETLVHLYNLRELYENGSTGASILRVINESLAKAVKENKGSYLLYTQAQILQQVFEHAAETGSFIQASEDHIPIELANGVTGLPQEDGVYILPKGTSVMRRMIEDDVSLPDGGKVTAEMLQDYAYLMSRTMRTQIEYELGTKLSKLTLREQFRFLDYAKKVSVQEAQELVTFTHTFGIDALRSFLVTGSDPVLRAKVFSFAQRSTPETVREVFQAYGKLVVHIDGVEEYLRETFTDTDDADTAGVVTQLLQRARDVLEKASRFASSGDEITAHIAHVDADIALFTSACKAMYRSGALNMEKITGVQIETKLGSELSSNDHMALLALQANAYKNKTPEFRVTLREGLKKAIATGAKFYLVRKEVDGVSKIVSTLRFDAPAEAGRVKHLASVLTDEDYLGGSIAEALLDEALAREQKDGSAVELECAPQHATLYALHGFVETEKFNFAGHPSVKMRKEAHVS